MLGFNETITVYNAVFDENSDCDIYRKAIISGCSWHSQHITGHDGTSFHRENVMKIRIPETARSSKAYVTPTEFTGAGCQYTLRSGDIIVKGVGPDISRPDELAGKSADLCTITVVHDNRRIGLKHLYVEGK